LGFGLGLDWVWVRAGLGLGLRLELGYIIFLVLKSGLYCFLSYFWFFLFAIVRNCSYFLL
jgi:hypothetical protein